MARLSSSSAPVKWDEEGLETAAEMRKKHGRECRRNSTDSNAAGTAPTPMLSLTAPPRRGAGGLRKGGSVPLVSDQFPEVDINNRPISSEVHTSAFICYFEVGVHRQH